MLHQTAKHVRSAAVVAIAFAPGFAMVLAHAVRAEVQVTADAGAFQVHATGSTVGEVLSALETACGLRVKSSAPLDRSVNGTFRGPLVQVLSRALQGYDYFISHRADAIEVTILGPHGDRPAALAPRPPPTPAMSLSEAVRLNRR
jgi:hypothetical protein